MANFVCPHCRGRGNLLFPEMAPPCPTCETRWGLATQEEQEVFDLVEVGGPLFAEPETIDPMVVEILRTRKRKGVIS